jgi:two-component system, LuxR family, sensor kinase FixL
MVPSTPRAKNARGDDSLFQTLLATTVSGVVVIDEKGVVEVYSQGCERLFQYSPEEMLGRNVSMLMPQPFRTEHDGYLERYKKTGEARIIGIGREVEGQRKDGTVFPIRLMVGEGRVNGKRVYLGIVHDLTALYSERAARQEEKAHLSLIVESSDDAIYSKTLDGTIITWNNAAETMFGYTAAEIVGQPMTRLFPPDRMREEDDILAKIFGGKAIKRYETVRLRKDGTPLDVSISASPIRDASGTIIGVSKIVRDISDRKAQEAHLERLNAELNHVARVSEMSQVSAGIAHELNQPLTAVLNYTNVAKRLMASEDPTALAKALEAVSKAGEQAIRASQIIRRLRDFLERRETSRSVENINTIAEEAMALGLIGAKAANIKTNIDFAPSSPLILVDRVQIQQVLVNLLRNAVEAMAESPRRELTVTTASLNGSGVEVVVADTGPGISEEIAGRLFKPFVTTKPGGMGIGLAISQSIVEAHGGTIRSTPNAGGGTIFQFTLPAAPMSK